MLDANCYRVFERPGGQYLTIMSLEKGQRIVLPLKGQAAIRGNVRIVVQGETVEVHVSQDVPAKRRPDPERVEAIDLGYSEAFVDTEGRRYGERLGALISAASDQRHATGRARNRLRARAEKYANTTPRKARHIRRFNLGQKTWDERERRARASIATEINTGLNRLVKTKRPAVLVSEELRHAFTFDRPKRWNRRLSAWVKGMMQDRIDFKALAEGFRHEQVNPAYGSQTCPDCGFVEAGNRKGDRFVCLHCGYEDHADRVGALNVLCRKDDREITRYTPYRAVKAILLQRFHRRLEADGAQVPAVTVPGRTPDTVPAAPPPPWPRGNPQRGDAMSHPTVTRRAKRNTNVIHE